MRKSFLYSRIIKFIQAIIEMLLIFPVLYTIAVFAFPEDIVLFLLVILAYYYLGILISPLLINRPRYIYLLLGLLISIVSPLFLIEGLILMILIMVTGFLAFIRGIVLGYRKWEESFSMSNLWIGLSLYLLTGLIFNIAPNLKGSFPLLGWFGVFYLVISLLIINFDKLKDSFQSADKSSFRPPTTMTRNNRILVILTLVIIFIVSFFSKLRELTSKAFKIIFNILASIYGFIARLFAASMGPGGGGFMDDGGMDFIPVEDTEPGIFMIILEKLFLIIAISVGLVLLYFGLKLLYKQLKKLYRYLKDILGERLAPLDSGGYIDEKETLLSFGEASQEYINRFQNFIKGLMEREPKWKDIKTNNLKIRYLYRWTLLKGIQEGYSYKDHLTPEETAKDIQKWRREEDELIDEMIDYYNKARYGDEDLETRDVNKRLEDIRKGEFL